MFTTVLSSLTFRYICLVLAFCFCSFTHANTLNQAIVLQYHHISNITPASTSVSPVKFIEHLNLINDMGFQVLPLTDVIKSINNSTQPTRKTLAISFDDGYLSIYQNAFPELKKRGLPFTIFISPNAIDNQHGNSLNWQQLKEMIEHGATIANHSLNHGHLLNLNKHETMTDWKNRIINNIESAQNRLVEKLAINHKLFAYPYGEFNQELINILKELNYTAFSQQSGPISSCSNLQALPRFSASGQYSELETLKIKIDSLAFDISEESPISQVHNLGEKAPLLELTIGAEDINKDQLQCFYLGERINTEVTKIVNYLIIKATSDTPLEEGRSRYNCTAPSLSQPSYYWYSMPFVSLKRTGPLH
ncbi:MAG: polysaccharide deacetylase family protein [Bermanella sp.]